MIYDCGNVCGLCPVLWCHFEMETPLDEAAFLCILTQFTYKVEYHHHHHHHTRFTAQPINNVYEQRVCEKKKCLSLYSEFGTAIDARYTFADNLSRGVSPYTIVINRVIRFTVFDRLFSLFICIPLNENNQ